MKSDPDQPSAVKQQCSRSDTVAEPHAMSLLRPPPLLLLPYLSTALMHVKEIGLVLLANVIQLFLLQVFSTISTASHNCSKMRSSCNEHYFLD